MCGLGWVGLERCCIKDSHAGLQHQRCPVFLFCLLAPHDLDLLIRGDLSLLLLDADLSLLILAGLNPLVSQDCGLPAPVDLDLGFLIPKAAQGPEGSASAQGTP